MRLHRRSGRGPWSAQEPLVPRERSAVSAASMPVKTSMMNTPMLLTIQRVQPERAAVGATKQPGTFLRTTIQAETVTDGSRSWIRTSNRNTPGEEGAYPEWTRYEKTLRPSEIHLHPKSEEFSFYPLG